MYLSNLNYFFRKIDEKHFLASSNEKSGTQPARSIQA